MKSRWNWFGVATLQRFKASTLLFIALFFSAVAGAQVPLPNQAALRSSASGQFTVIGAPQTSPLASLPAIATNAGLIRLEPALLAVSAERVKQSAWRALGIDPLAAWRGRVYLVLHPAASLDENVAIISTRFVSTWNYRVELPDVVSRVRLARALTGVVLLELANRDNVGGRSAELPSWLTEGLTQQLLAEDPTLLLSAPDRLAPVFAPSVPGAFVNDVPENRINLVQRGVDPLAQARAALQDHPALSFEQLSWPDDAQTDDDGGVYRASAQLFVSDLLALKDGAGNLRAMLGMLPRVYNWQTAFRAAFAGDFPQPIDVEKWWNLQTVSFAARGAGPLWTPSVSGERLDEILSVPVDFRSSSNDLPARAAISLQAVVGNFDFARQSAILQTTLRDLELAHWRMAPPVAALAEAYRRVLADYLGGRNAGAEPRPIAPSKGQAAATIKKLDALDAQRRLSGNR